MAGRPRARTQIVAPQDVLDNQAIRTEKWAMLKAVSDIPFRISMEDLPPE